MLEQFPFPFPSHCTFQNWNRGFKLLIYLQPDQVVERSEIKHLARSCTLRSVVCVYSGTNYRPHNAAYEVMNTADKKIAASQAALPQKMLL